MTLEMFPRRQNLIDMIPDPSDMSPPKLLGGIPVPEGADIHTLCWTRMGGGIPSMVKRGYIYTPNKLLQHLTMVVIPLQRTLKVPEHPPMNLPTRPSLPTLGTKASDIVDMDLQSTQQNIQLRIDAYKERERLEEEGISDQLSELQQFTLVDFLTAVN